MTEKLKQVKALQKQFKMTFREACFSLGYKETDPDLIDTGNLPPGFEQIFGKQWGSE